MIFGNKLSPRDRGVCGTYLETLYRVQGTVITARVKIAHVLNICTVLDVVQFYFDRNGKSERKLDI